MALTRDHVFWDAFAKQADASVRAAHILEKMTGDLGNSPRYAEEIRRIEDEGDQITLTAVNALHQTWITPLDREEIHSLISAQDDVLDLIHATSDRVELFELTSLFPEAAQLASLIVKQTEQIRAMMDQLKNMKDLEPVLKMCTAVRVLEKEADVSYRRALAHLFKEKLDPMDVMRWRDVLEAMETATDRCEDVANIVEGIVLEHA